MPGIENWTEHLADMVREQLSDRSGVPEVTYRLQFHPSHFRFADATAIVSYLRDLGASHLYASPYLAARPESAHGYDVIDHGRLNPELGDDEEYRQLVEALHQCGMGQILDIVPNHMGIATSDNPWWNDVLENGPSSPYAHFFDIDWRPVKTELRNKLLLPILGEQYGQVLESGQLQLRQQGGHFVLQYYELSLPIEPKSCAVLLSHRFDELKTQLGADAEPLIELESILTALDYLPPYEEIDPDSISERQREKEVIKGRLERLVNKHEEIAAFIARNIEDFNGDPDVPGSFDLLDDILARQVYRLSHWKAASDEINYRRFFDINELAALCMEEPDVFEATHRFIFELLAEGSIDGLRIDHIDGLFDPEEYLWRLQWGYLRSLGRAAHARLSEAPHRAADDVESLAAIGGRTQTAVAVDEAQPAIPPWETIEPHLLTRLHADVGGEAVSRLFPRLFTPEEEDEAGGATAESPPGLSWSRRGLPLYVIVEKILEANEDLPANWPVAGTTGYEFLNSAAGLFVDIAGARDIKKRYQRFTGQKKDLLEVVYRSKRLIINMAMAAELQLLAVRIGRLSEQHRRFRDFTLNNLRTALQEIIACFPIYRTYITAESAADVSERDRQFIATAVRRARRRNPTLDARLFEFVRDVLLLKQPPDLDEKSLHERRVFVGRFQQVSSPVMAKGVEDTAFYRYFPLCSLNEVGGGFEMGTNIADFHAENAARQRHRAGSLLCTTSHDTKRSEDVRARISVLSEVPDQWRTALSQWSRFNRRHRRTVDGDAAPSRNDEYLFYQTLVGVWPIDPPQGDEREELIERVAAYMEKATHEAKVHTSWVNPNPDYDDAVRRFVHATLADSPNNRFLPSFLDFHERILDWGLRAALSQLVLKLTAPGVPDLYQGQELWDFSLVDPDNRRPVDYDKRRWLLSEMQAILADGPDALLELARYLGQNPRDERLKMFVTWRSLLFRRRQSRLFQHGRYVSLSVSGERAEHLIAYAWRRDSSGNQAEDFAVVVVPRWMVKLAKDLGADDDGDFHGELDPRQLWPDTSIRLDGIPPGKLVNIFTGQTFDHEAGQLAASEAFADFPVAILCRPELTPEPAAAPTSEPRA